MQNVGKDITTYEIKCVGGDPVCRGNTIVSLPPSKGSKLSASITIANRKYILKDNTMMLEGADIQIDPQEPARPEPGPTPQEPTMAPESPGILPKPSTVIPGNSKGEGTVDNSDSNGNNNGEISVPIVTGTPIEFPGSFTSTPVIPADSTRNSASPDIYSNPSKSLTVTEWGSTAAAPTTPPFLQTCSKTFAKIKIKCVFEISQHCGSKTAVACASPDGTMYLPRENCKKFNLCSTDKDGECEVSPVEFAKLTQCQGNVVDDAGIDSCCVVRHEFGHLCDPDLNDRGGAGSKTYKCGEVIAEDMGATCYNETTDYYCGGESPRWAGESDIRCKQACDQDLWRSVGKVWDACMCNQAAKSESGVSGDQCCWCVNEATDAARVYNLLPASCHKFYPDPNLASFKDILEKYAGERPYSGHGCSYYNPKATPGESCPPPPTLTPTPSTVTPRERCIVTATWICMHPESGKAPPESVCRDKAKKQCCFQECIQSMNAVDTEGVPAGSNEEDCRKKCDQLM